MAHHPLAALRASLQLSQAAYARRVAETHRSLGFGALAARREKVARWESGRIVPELSAQLAIAHLHQVPAHDVHRLGWPGWLQLAADGAELLTRPLGTPAAVDVLTTPAVLDGTNGHHLTVTGRVLVTQLRQAAAALSAPRGSDAREATLLQPAVLDWLEQRLAALEVLEYGTTVPPEFVFTAARAEHQLVYSLLTAHGYAHALGRRLLALATRTSTLCAWTSGAVGEDARSERYSLAALRAAAAAGGRQNAAAAAVALAIRHMRVGTPQDVLSLVHGARAMLPRTPPRLAFMLHAKESHALARLGERSAAMVAMTGAERALAGDAAGGGPVQDPTGALVDENFLSFSRGYLCLQLGLPGRALAYFTPLVEAHRSSPSTAPVSPHAPLLLSHVVEAQLALDEPDAAVSTARRALGFHGDPPPSLVRQFRRLLSGNAGATAVREFLTEFAEPTAPRFTTLPGAQG
ncbi:hypothetical protein [Kitasatospora sp. LaBMicrA B282]|uniref:hypothetical protein n=1 Tax=Kitasatospora sp. LaBMicrA B282 TaxID=3420949 RepID=UPI003D14646B